MELCHRAGHSIDMEVGSSLLLRLVRQQQGAPLTGSMSGTSSEGKPPREACRRPSTWTIIKTAQDLTRHLVISPLAMLRHGHFQIDSVGWWEGQMETGGGGEGKGREEGERGLRLPRCLEEDVTTVLMATEEEEQEYRLQAEGGKPGHQQQILEEGVEGEREEQHPGEPAHYRLRGRKVPGSRPPAPWTEGAAGTRTARLAVRRWRRHPSRWPSALGGTTRCGRWCS